MTSLAAVRRIANAHDLDVTATADAITIHIRSWVQPMLFFGPVREDADHNMTCDGVPVRFVQPSVPAQRGASA